MKKKNKKPKKPWTLALREAGLNPKKEIAIIVFGNVLLLVFAAFVYKMTDALIAPLSIGLLLIVSDYFLLGKVNRVKKTKAEALEKEFVHVFSYFKIFVGNGRPVYNAIEDCIRYSSPEMSDHLTNLLGEIDKDKSVKPYLNFASHFKSLEIRQVMISIYKMGNEGGSSTYIEQFQSVFSSIANEKRKYELSKFESTLNNNNFLPLADSALTMGLIIVAIVVIMGNLTYGI